MSGLNRLYNSKVVEASKVDRPLMNNWAGRALQAIGIEHKGVLIKNDAGQQYLVHKGSNYGGASDTVVTDARHMSDNWSVSETKQVNNARVADYVKAGGTDYNMLTDNCIHATDRMYNNNN